MNSSSRFERFIVVFAASCLLCIISFLLQGQAGSPGIAGPSTKATTAKAATTSTSGPSSQPTTTAAAPKTIAPASIAELLKAAQGAFEAANAADWTTSAAKQVTLLQSAIKKLKTDLPKPNVEQQKRLTQINSDITAMNTAIKSKQHQTVLSQANRIWRVSGLLADSFINKVPQGLWQMQYVAREMEVWSTDPADLTKLKTLPARLDTEWAALSKEATAKGGEALAKEYGDEIAKLKAAATADDFAKLVKPLLITLDKFEKAYQ